PKDGGDARAAGTAARAARLPRQPGVAGRGVDVGRRVDAAGGVGVAIQGTAAGDVAERTERARPARDGEAVPTEAVGVGGAVAEPVRDLDGRVRVPGAA